MLDQCHLVCSMDVCFSSYTHCIFREVLNLLVIIPDRSETQSPTGSMCTIRSMASMSTHLGSGVSGSHSTTFLLPIDTIPKLSDF